MPQVDLETIVSVCAGGTDRKIACETLADDPPAPPENPDLADIPPDFPPESFWLSKDAEYDWFDRNAFYERKESTKGNSNSTNLNPNPNSNSSSQRFSMNLKSKASIIGLPKTQKASYVDTKRRTCKPANIRLFPKRSESVGKSTVPVTEPSSPKVSCMGRVRSKRGRRRQQAAKQPKTAAKGLDQQRNDDERRRTGLYAKFMNVFRFNRRVKRSVERSEPVADSPPRRSVTIKMREIPASDEPGSEAPGLGGMKRFASGRRSTSSWTDDLDQTLDVRVSISESLDGDCRVERSDGGPIRRI